MFNSKKGPQSLIDNTPVNKADTTIIGSSSKFDGTLNTSGVIRVDGYFSGELNVEGNLIVGENGYIKGNIKSDRDTIAGKVEGNIHCGGCIEITASGKLYGDIEEKNISIEDGAVFEGKCIMAQQPSTSRVPKDSTGSNNQE
jgi:cytoskeletal protein CcmA (bactofilin family)